MDTRGDVAGDRVSVEARVWDLKSRKLIFGRRYSGGATFVERIAHTLANDILKELTGQSGMLPLDDPVRLGPRRRAATRRSTRWTSTAEIRGG